MPTHSISRICLYNGKITSQYFFAYTERLFTSYPNNNCNISGPVNPSDLLSNTYLNHQAVASVTSSYINAANQALAANVPFIMFETNIASCGGFSSLSDSFASTLWFIDFAFNMAYGNFSNALMHVGGQNDYYNVGSSSNDTFYY